MEYLKIDSEDFEDLLFQIENSFQVEFDFQEIHNNLSIQQIIDKVVIRLNLQEGSGCSSQITFFRLRQQVLKKHTIDSSKISLETKLIDIFPFKNRRKEWAETFANSDLKVPKLEPPLGLLLPSILTALISFFFIFGKNWNYGLPIFLVSIVIIYLCNRYGKALPCKDLKELTNHIVKFDYRGTRNKIGTYNPTEVKQTIFSLFTDWLSDEERKRVSFDTKIDYIEK